MKKKLVSIVCLCLCALCFLASCNDGGEITLPPETDPVSPAGTSTTDVPADDTYVFPYKGQTLRIGARMAPVAEALGTPTLFDDSVNCGDQGEDRLYVYPGVKIYSHEAGSDELITDITFTDDSVATAEGVRVGATAAEVVAAMGSGYTETSGSYIYKKGGTALQILLRDGVVYAIQYTGAN